MRNSKKLRIQLVVWVLFLSLNYSVSLAQDCLLGDVNLDGTVDLLDTRPLCSVIVKGGPYVCEADVLHDGIVNILDLGHFDFVLRHIQGSDFQDATVDGPGDFFWSTANLNEGAINQEASIFLPVGQSAVLNLYYTTNGPSGSEVETGAAINVATSNSGVVSFTDAQTYNFSVFFQGSEIWQRWSYPENFSEQSMGSAPAHSIDTDLVVGMFAINPCTEVGMIEEPLNGLAEDGGYDADADAFLYGYIEVQAIAPGKIVLAAGSNNLGIVNDNSIVNATFARATITTFVLGDTNMDGVVSLLDVEPFVDALTGGIYIAEADCNQDGLVDLLDIAPFILILNG